MIMIKTASILLLSLSLGTASAASCVDQAAGKKLPGKARTDFLTKCEKDVVSLCESTAEEQKFSGAVKSSFVKQCTKDLIGEK